MKVQINIMVLHETVIKLAKHFHNVFLTAADQAALAMTTQFAHQNVLGLMWRFVCFN